MRKKPMVSVCMITYNHEKYIETAIQGVLIQQTNFDVEFIISNDASTDGTHAAIANCIKDSKHITVRYFNQAVNKGIIPNFVFTLEQSEGAYLALCEGDDYWTDPLKLQKQFDFLENNSTFIAHCHNTHFVDESRNNQKERLFSTLPSREIQIADICPVRSFHTASLFFRNEAVERMDLPYLTREVLSGDKYLYLMLFLSGKIYYDAAPMAFYRRNEGGASTSPRVYLFMNSDIKMYTKFLPKVPNEYRTAIAESVNYYKLNRFNFLLQKRFSLRLVYYYFHLLPLIGKSNYIQFNTFKKLTKKLLKKII